MKTLIAGLASWKSTLLGAVVAGLLVWQEHLKNGVTMDDPQLWIAIGIAALGFVLRDADVSSQDSKIRPS